MINTIKISLNCQVIQNEGNIVSDMDGETVMLNVQKGKYYNLGELGGVIWSYLEESIKVSEVVTALISEYEIEQKECEEHLVTFLNQLLSENLISILDESSC
ncbi:lasso peptide biosynthesis PqqD family chaperone [Bacillus sp. AFS017336]|uniref:lasso peptide biosynthesis PqqD family chaperone n=1 Tax=Bacillus sp. AFS017336 TaxID=2033489 RepID=UPI000BF1BBC4|nr:lasso peptide biosynthesis PqqD family chaperone [Bacillus sp. AFS017336]PEL07014.1 PqqD family protein [Bacillus sp. AFS017336]